MMELVIELGVLVVLLTVLVGWLAAWRIGQVVSWQALVKTAWLTHSFADCVGLIRFCVEARELANEHQSGLQPVAREQFRTGHVREEWPRVS
jgi:hypothetical protein